MEAKTVTLKINGREHQTAVFPNQTLLETLRELAYFEVKSGCEKGDCGACAVLVEGEAVNSCLTLTWSVAGRSITTVAGLGSPEHPHPLVTELAENGAIQCGYCTPGTIIAAQSMLSSTPAPSDDDIRIALSGNLCRCSGYTRTFQAVRKAAAQMCEGGSGHGG